VVRWWHRLGPEGLRRDDLSLIAIADATGRALTTESIAIRAADRNDLDAVRLTVEVAYTSYIARIGRPPAPMSADYKRAIEEGSVWVAEAGARVSGVLVLYPAPNHLFLDTIAVLPSVQGSGVGTALLAFAETYARSLGLGEIRLYTNELMVENLTYYPRRGYVEVSRGIEAGFHRVYFVKRLDG
jgi:GNAT superfamily N-acetyltransferase